jgi:hypothetical protein
MNDKLPALDSRHSYRVRENSGASGVATNLRRLLSGSKGRGFPLPAFAGTGPAGMTLREVYPMAFGRTWYQPLPWLTSDG